MPIPWANIFRRTVWVGKVLSIVLVICGCNSKQKPEAVAPKPADLQEQKPSGENAKKVQVVQLKNGDWQLLVHGKPFVVKGVAYGPTKVGTGPSDGAPPMVDWMIEDDDGNGIIDSPFESWVDSNNNDVQDPQETAVGDFRLLQKMGCNTIRMFHHPSDAPELEKAFGDSVARVEYFHKPNKAVLRDLYSKYGIRVIMGDFLGAYCIPSGASWEKGTDYTDDGQKELMRASVRQMVNDFKDEEFLLMWCLGNENNYPDLTHTNAATEPEAYAKFVNEIVRMIHAMDPNHPVVLCNGDQGLIDAYARHTPDIDIFGMNCFRSPDGFLGVWESMKQNYLKPVLITSYGPFRPDAEKFLSVNRDQAVMDWHRNNWADIANNVAGGKGAGNSIGGVAFAWLDDWWRNGDASDLSDSEAICIAGQGDGQHSPFLRQLRPVYFMYEEVWNSSK